MPRCTEVFTWEKAETLSCFVNFLNMFASSRAPPQA